jgi:hypothetical protein
MRAADDRSFMCPPWIVSLDGAGWRVSTVAEFRMESAVYTEA